MFESYVISIVIHADDSKSTKYLLAHNVTEVKVVSEVSQTEIVVVRTSSVSSSSPHELCDSLLVQLDFIKRNSSVLPPNSGGFKIH